MTAMQDISSARLPALTGMRFVAALSVFLSHGSVLFVFADQGIQQRYYSVAGSAGLVGVSFFFVLSGFVLTWSARPTDTAPTFWRRRLVRVFPNQVVVWVIAVALLLAAGEQLRVPQALASLFLLHAWIPVSSFIAYSVNGLVWSLSVELAFYAAFPLLYLVIRRVRPERLWYWLAGGVLGALLVPVFALTVLPDGNNPFLPGISWPQMWFSHFFPVTRGMELLVGMVLARLVLSGRLTRVPVLPAAALVVVVYFVALELPAVFRIASLYPLPLGLLIVALANSDIRGRRNLVNSRPMVWLGDTTYAFFLIHLVLLFNVHAWFSGQWAGYGPYQGESWSTPVALAFLAGMLVLTVGLARLLYRFVQVPATRRWQRSRSQRRVTQPT